jgi:RNA polymerase sigma-70 factor (ECF subfamily)
MMQDEILLNRALTGDREALNELVSIYWHPVYRFVAYKTGNPEDAQELTQEAFFRAFRALPTYLKNDATFKTYVNHIAFNLIKDFWRKRGRSPQIVDIANVRDTQTGDDLPEVQAINQERHEALKKVLQGLPDDQRQVIELRIIAGLPIRDAALAMGKSEAAIKMLQQRALKSLRILLVDHGISGDGAEWR